ncbi:MAG: TAT-variant-translocated molybdopterin oxidoreductase [Planctomycetes bacterium]|nr:TAT-variant-translocated molybdopterin oxidoreductase [Planctomycetota bacterium]
MSSLERSESTQKYWRSLNELEQTPEFQALVETEFPGGPEEEWTESSRRRFLQLMGASLALGSMSSCRWQKEYITPMVDRPEDWVPGKPRHYASMMQVGGVAAGVVVTSYDGRPTKVEGSPKHPAGAGTSTYAQAATLELCDPDRSQAPCQIIDGAEVDASWEGFESFLVEQLYGLRGSGGGLAVIAQSDSSPAMAALRRRFEETYPEATWVEWEAWSRDEEAKALASLFGGPTRPTFKAEAADILLTLDDDFLELHPEHKKNARGYASRRKPEERAMNRHYAVEPSFSVTGVGADHRLPVRGSQVAGVLLAIQAELAVNYGVGSAPASVPTTGLFASGPVQAFVKAVAGDLATHRGSCLVTAGVNQPAEVHATVVGLNIALGNRGNTVEYHAADGMTEPGTEELSALVESMRDGAVDTVVCLGTNPVYDSPADLEFTSAYSRVANRIHYGLYRDETAMASTWHVNAAHWLEAWADGRSWDGTHTFAQPLIAPLYDGRDRYAFVGGLIGRGDIEAQSWIQQQFNALYGPDELAWRKAIQRGFQPGTSFVKAGAPGVAPALTMDSGQLEPWDESMPLEAVFRLDSKVYDGRFANLGWLQELPDPLTKLTWDNAAVIGVGTANALGLKDHDLVEFELNGRKLELAVYVMPGQAPGTVGLPIGYGRTTCGHVAGLAADEIDPVGFDTYKLRTTDAMAFGQGMTVDREKKGFYQLVSTQDHHVIDTTGMDGRADRIGDLVRSGTLEEWRDHPDFAQHRVHHPPLKSTWKEHEYSDYKWGMAVDLSACNGCGACTVACNAENNVPIVGKDQVFKGREMTWMRMDRYFTGDPENPQVVSQPVSCMHCENAPCEQVCPVAATVHSSEGTNDMVYNRCIGTRYCSNNCPYKVRRFNFLNWNEDLQEEDGEVRKLSMNPEVTVRVRGVMEKCSYCIQRISAARIERHSKGERIQDGDVVSACQDVCPSEAIYFGDLNDESSAVRKKHDNDRAYAMLPELNNKPRTVYLAAIRNLHPDLAPAYEPHGGHGGHGGDGHHSDGHSDDSGKEVEHV